MPADERTACKHEKNRCEFRFVSGMWRAGREIENRVAGVGLGNRREQTEDHRDGWKLKHVSFHNELYGGRLKSDHSDPSCFARKKRFRQLAF
jgi:hypothetical protein